jgi:hypothetical protein
VKAAPEPARIVQFYAAPGLVERGDPVTVCYGVENAKSVRLQPSVEEIKPAVNRCFQLTPKETVTFTLFASGADGREVSRSITVNVVPRSRPAAAAPAPQQPASMIVTFAASAQEVERGRPVTLCYGVRDAVSVRLEPGGRTLDPVESKCFMISPPQTATYTLIVTGPGKRTEREQVTIKVR